jgi:hypothetical protein
VGILQVVEGSVLRSIAALICLMIASVIATGTPASAILVTLANGGANSGYIPIDAASGSYTFQVLGSRLKPGCAENVIAGGLTELLNQQ